MWLWSFRKIFFLTFIRLRSVVWHFVWSVAGVLCFATKRPAVFPWLKGRNPSGKANIRKIQNQINTWNNDEGQIWLRNVDICLVNTHNCMNSNNKIHPFNKLLWFVSCAPARWLIGFVSWWKLPTSKARDLTGRPRPVSVNSKPFSFQTHDTDKTLLLCRYKT